MKKIWLFFIVLLVSVTAIAQKPKSTLRFSLSDHQLLTVTINERDYQKVGTSLVFSDIPKKRHSIRIYKFRPYADGSGGKAELLYVGNIKIEPGKKYDFVYNVNSKKLQVKQVRNFETLPTYKGNYIPYQKAPLNPDNDRAIEISNASDGLSSNNKASFELPSSYAIDMPEAMKTLQLKMSEKVKDEDKLVLAENYINNNKLTVQQAGMITSWINFDDNKLLFLNMVKGKISDPENVRLLADQLTLQKSKEQFLNGL